MTTPTIRQRWKMYRKCVRLAARVREGRSQIPAFEPEVYDRAARDWAAPFLHRIPEVANTETNWSLVPAQMRERATFSPHPRLLS